VLVGLCVGLLTVLNGGISRVRDVPLAILSSEVRIICKTLHCVLLAILRGSVGWIRDGRLWILSSKIRTVAVVLHFRRRRKVEEDGGDVENVEKCREKRNELDNFGICSFWSR
jgi:hypothetical protein